MNVGRRRLAELIAATPGAQTLTQALASIAARRARLVPEKPATEPVDFNAREPLPPLEDPDAFAKGFWQRLKDKAPPRGGKPRLVVRNDDDEPEPPKAA